MNNKNCLYHIANSTCNELLKIIVNNYEGIRPLTKFAFNDENKLYKQIFNLIKYEKQYKILDELIIFTNKNNIDLNKIMINNNGCTDTFINMIIKTFDHISIIKLFKYKENNNIINLLLNEFYYRVQNCLDSNFINFTDNQEKVESVFNSLIQILNLISNKNINQDILFTLIKLHLISYSSDYKDKKSYLIFLQDKLFILIKLFVSKEIDIKYKDQNNFDI